MSPKNVCLKSIRADVDRWKGRKMLEGFPESHGGFVWKEFLEVAGVPMKALKTNALPKQLNPNDR
jgi:hypothetical protein